MLIRGFDKETMKKFFNYFVEHGNFENRKVTYNDKGNVANLEEGKSVDIEEEIFKSDIATTIIKIFYKKKPEDFKTKDFQRACKEFHRRIETSPNPDAVKNTLNVIYNSNKSHMYYSFFEEIHCLFCHTDGSVPFDKEALSGGVDYDIIENDRAVDLRIYVNPSQNEYRHFVTFLQSKALQEEVVVQMKPRMKGCSSREELDNLILYMSKEDFPKVLNILHEYESLYPSKVAKFGGSIEGLARTKSDWFGFGLEPQKGKSGSIHTFNDFINKLFNDYVLPAVFLEDFDAITEGVPLKEKYRLLKISAIGEDLAKQLAEALAHGINRKAFLRSFVDLSHLKIESDEFTRTSPTNNPKYSPIRLRVGEGTTEEGLISGYSINKKFLTGGSISISRHTVSKIVANPEFRKLMQEYYQKHPEVIEEKAQYMLKLFKYIGESSPYLDDNMPFLSKEVVDAFKTMGIELTADADEAESTI